MDIRSIGEEGPKAVERQAAKDLQAVIEIRRDGNDPVAEELVRMTRAVEPSRAAKVLSTAVNFLVDLVKREFDQKAFAGQVGLEVLKVPARVGSALGLLAGGELKDALTAIQPGKAVFPGVERLESKRSVPRGTTLVAEIVTDPLTWHGAAFFAKFAGRAGAGVSGRVVTTGAVEAGGEAAVLAGSRGPVAVDTTAFYSLFGGRRPPDAWQKVVTELLSGRDVRVPETMIKELTVKSGLSRAEVLQKMASVAGKVEVLPEGAFATRAALKEAGLAGRRMVWDRRIGASAVDLERFFATGDKRQAKAVVDVLERILGSREAARQRIISLRPKGVPGLKGWDPGALAILFAAGLGGVAASDEPSSTATVTPGSW